MHFLMESCVFFIYLLSWRYFAFALKHSYAQFYYTKDKSHPLYLDPYARSLLDDSCKVCYGADDCLGVTGSWCGYYVETARILEEENVGQISKPNKELRDAVDFALFNLTSEASADDKYTECIPLVSQYTNCNKDNICTGCQRCSCTGVGKWECAQVEQCRPRSSTLVVDHRVLLLAMESLLGVGNRIKRSPPDQPSQKEIYGQIARWMSDIKPKTLETISLNPHSDTLRNMVEDIFKELNYNASVKEGDNFTFDDLLKNTEPMNQNANTQVVQYNREVTTDSNDILDLLNMIESDNGTKPVEVMSENNTVIRFEDIQPKNGSNSLVNNNYFEGNYLFNDLHLDESQNESGLNTAQILKRDVSHANKEGMNAETLQDLNDSILIPMINIIAEKQSEIDELLQVKDNIVKFIKSNTSFNLTSNKIHENTSHYAVYKLEISPTLATIINRNELGSHTSVKDYIELLKHDLLNVLRDIAMLRKTLKGKDVPKDLKYLATAIRYYIQEQARHELIKQQHTNTNLVSYNNIELDNLKSITKNMGENFKVTSFIKDTILKILRIVDRGIPESDGLEPLTPHSRKIMRRILDLLLSNEIKSGQKEINANTNIVKELKHVESKFQRVIKTSNSRNIYDRLHKFKMMHLEVVEIINKLTEILDLLKLHRTRRIKVDEKDVRNLIRNINNKMQIITKDIEVQSKRNEKITETTMQSSETHKKFSFIRRLMKMMKGFMHKKRTDPEPVPQKKIDDDKTEANVKLINDLEESMLNWQKVIAAPAIRKKRSQQFLRLKNRIQNIIPKYLRKKIPAKPPKKATEKSGSLKKKHKRSLTGEIFYGTAPKDLTFYPSKSLSHAMSNNLYNLGEGYLYDPEIHKRIASKLVDSNSLTFIPGSNVIDKESLNKLFPPTVKKVYEKKHQIHNVLRRKRQIIRGRSSTHKMDVMLAVTERLSFFPGNEYKQAIMEKEIIGNGTTLTMLYKYPKTETLDKTRPMLWDPKATKSANGNSTKRVLKKRKKYLKHALFKRETNDLIEFSRKSHNGKPLKYYYKETVEPIETVEKIYQVKYKKSDSRISNSNENNEDATDSIVIQPGKSIYDILLKANNLSDFISIDNNIITKDSESEVDEGQTNSPIPAKNNKVTIEMNKKDRQLILPDVKLVIMNKSVTKSPVTASQPVVVIKKDPKSFLEKLWKDFTNFFDNIFH